MDIGKAIAKMREGEHVAREGWSGKTLAIQEPGPNSKMTEDYIYENDGNGKIVPWCASNKELLADDWIVVDVE